MTARSRRILFVTSAGYLPRAISGDVVSLDALCRSLAGIGLEPMVVCAAYGAPQAEHGFAPGYPVLRLPDPVAAMMEMVPRLEPDAVVVRGPWPAVQAARWAAARGRRLHVYFTAAAFDYGFPPPREAPGLRYAANSRFIAGLSQALVGTQVALLPPLIEPEAYRCTARGDAVLFVNPVPEKGAHLVAAIAESLPHRRFLVARSWPDHPDHRHVAIDLPNVEWVASGADMRPIYARTRLVLMPSMWEEALGRVVWEAQVSGIPAIVSARGGLPEAAGSGGIAVPVTAPVARWCAEIERVFTDDAHYAALSAGALREAAGPERRRDAVIARFLDFMDG